MKRLLILLLLLVPGLAFAANADRDVLLASNGKLYSIESTENAAATSNGAAMRFLTLTVQDENDTETILVPASLTAGNHWRPKLAYDSDTQTLFVFWLRSANSMLASSDLVFASYHDEEWTAAKALDDTPFSGRSNFSVAATRKIEVTTDNNTRLVPGLTLHLTWWSESGRGEAAQYAMLTVENGEVVDLYKRPLMDFVDSRLGIAATPAQDNLEIFRYPTVFESPTNDTVDVVFGDIPTNKFHRLTLKPVLKNLSPNARIRIPINVKDHGFNGPGKLGKAAVNVTTMTADDAVIFYYVDGNSMRYLVNRDGVWLPSRTVKLTDKVTLDTAVTALRKMVETE